MKATYPYSQAPLFFQHPFSSSDMKAFQPPSPPHSLLLRYEIFGQPATNHYRKLGANILGNCEIQLPGKKVAADLDFQLVWILADRSAKIFSSCQIQLPGIYGT